jgi:DNA recombination protein RmuC
MIPILLMSLLILVCLAFVLSFLRNQKLKFRCQVLEIQKQAVEEQERQLIEKNHQLLEQLEHKQSLYLDTQLKLTAIEAQTEAWKKAAEEKLALTEVSKEKLTESFKALSMDSLEKNSQAFLMLAQATLEKFQEKAEGSFEKKSHAIQELFTPVKETLSKIGDGMQQLEKERKGDHATLQEQLRSMVASEKDLKEETSILVRALRAPNIRGRWGEMQLRRVVELCGMVSHCDFFEQRHEVHGESALRPDMIIKLPGDKQVVVDAKTPFEAYFEAMQETDHALKENMLKQHAKHLRTHVIALGKKAYWEHFQPSPEFVVLFLPSESFFSAALEQDPSLIEIGIDQKVVIATPMTLIGLLRAIAYGWKQDKLSKNTQDIYELGKELYKRIGDVYQHIAKLGKSLATSVESYNKMMGSLETRVLVTVRKFHSLGVGEEEDCLSASCIEQQPKPPSTLEFIEKIDV